LQRSLGSSFSWKQAADNIHQELNLFALFFKFGFHLSLPFLDDPEHSQDETQDDKRDSDKGAEHPEHDVELGIHFRAEIVNAPIYIIEALTHIIEAPIHIVEAPIHIIEALIHIIEALIESFLAFFQTGEALYDFSVSNAWCRFHRQDRRNKKHKQTKQGEEANKVTHNLRL
jgi:hypothetical protein